MNINNCKLLHNKLNNNSCSSPLVRENNLLNLIFRFNKYFFGDKGVATAGAGGTKRSEAECGESEANGEREKKERKIIKRWQYAYSSEARIIMNTRTAQQHRT